MKVGDIVDVVAIEPGEAGAWVLTDSSGARWLTDDPAVAAVVAGKIGRFGRCLVSSPLVEMP